MWSIPRSTTRRPTVAASVGSSWRERLRRDARRILNAGVDAVEPRALVRSFLESSPPAAVSGRLSIAAIGKAAAAMAQGAFDAVGERVSGGVVVAAPGTGAGAPAGLTVFEGGHPVPNEEGLRGAAAIYELARGLGPDDLLLCLISGGGSALMTLPPESVPLEDVRAATETLLRAGATINDLNCVRKHLDRLKGGRLAAAAEPARVVALVLSDVVGDPLDVIASGPVSPDPTRFADASAVLERFDPDRQVPAGVRRYIEAGLSGRERESPKAGEPCFDRVEATVIGNNLIAVEAAAEAARALGYATELGSTACVGEAREVGARLAALGRELDAGGRAPACVLSAGETTVTVRGDGRGGRNQELALGAALALEGTERVLVASMGTDGIDGPTDAAGALADGETVERASRLGLDAEASLARNDSHGFFERLDDLIVTGPTGTNVMDLMAVLVAGEIE